MHIVETFYPMWIVLGIISAVMDLYVSSKVYTDSSETVGELLLIVVLGIASGPLLGFMSMVWFWVEYKKMPVLRDICRILNKRVGNVTTRR